MMSLTTPALLFPAISLLMLAYGGRFLALAALVRQLTADYGHGPDSNLARQIANLRVRLTLIKTMQIFGTMSFLACSGAMFALFLGHQDAGEWVFGLSLVFLIVSLLLSLWELWISTTALRHLMNGVD